MIRLLFPQESVGPSKGPALSQDRGQKTTFRTLTQDQTLDVGRYVTAQRCPPESTHVCMRTPACSFSRAKRIIACLT